MLRFMRRKRFRWCQIDFTKQFEAIYIFKGVVLIGHLNILLFSSKKTIEIN